MKNYNVYIPLVLLLYFGIFHDLFKPLLKGEIKLFFISAMIPTFLIVFVLIMVNLIKKLDYDELKK